MSEAKSIEDMKAELEANDYTLQESGILGWYDFAVEIIAPDGWFRVATDEIYEGVDWEIEDAYERQKERVWNDAVSMAWQHYQREKRYAELEAGMEKLQARVAKVERELESLRGDGK